MNKQFILLILSFFAFLTTGFAQQVQGWQLEKMPADLETEYALSSLPPRLRNEASVYLLDPTKGYYLSRKGTNGFFVFIVRTQWELAEFLSGMYTSISLDEEGAKTFMPMFFDVAAMRATGKFTPQQIRDTVLQRVKSGVYRAPSRTGISYMLCPISRTHRSDGFVNEVMPHYMFYAPGVDDKDIGGLWEGGRSTPFAIGTGDLLDKEHSIFNLIILPAGEMEKAKIIEENKDLLQKLVAYKSYFKIDTYAMNEKEHHH